MMRLETEHSKGAENFALIPDMSIDIGDPPSLKFIAIDEIAVDDAYQRDEKAQHIKRIAREFLWHKFGCVTLARRDDGGYYVVDGQQRIAACRRRGDIKKVPAVIFDADKVGDEAASFLGINRDRKGVTPLDRHKAALVARDTRALDLERACNFYGLEIAARGDSGYIAAISTLETIYAMGKSEGVTATLHVLVYGLQESPEFKQAAGLRAINKLLRQMPRLERDFDYQEFARRFKNRTPEEIHRFIQKVRASRVRVHPERDMWSALVRLHDHKRSAKKRIADRLLAIEE